MGIRVMPIEGGGRVASKADFDSAEWEILLYVPVTVFFAVAYADGKIQYPESNTFAIVAKNVAAQAKRPQDALVREVMAEVSANFGQIGARMDSRVNAGLTYQEILAAGRNILDTRVENVEGLVFKNTMIQLAQQVAEAWPLFGRKVTAGAERDQPFAGFAWLEWPRRRVHPL